MLKVLNSEGNFTPLNGILYKKEVVDFIQLKKILLEKADKKAKLILEEASLEASEIKELAFSKGYHDGFQTVLKDMGKFLAKNSEYTIELRNKIFSDIEMILGSVTRTPELLLSIVSEWLTCANANSERLFLKLPECYEENEEILINGLSRSWLGEIKIEYHASDKIIIYCDNRVAEFDAPGFINDVVELISEKYDIDIIKGANKISSEITKDCINYNFE